jgi:hypothetical protein
MIANRLISLAVVAMLAFAPIFNPVAAQNSTLTPELLARMLDFIARKGTDRDVPAIFANGMFLTLAGQAWPSRQLVREEITGGIIHSISISRGSNKDILLSKNTKERIDIYRIERDGILVVAGVYDLPTRDFNTRGTRDRAEVQKEVDDELENWSAWLARQ